MINKCELCEMKKITEWKLVVCKCKTHKDKWMIVWGKHKKHLHYKDRVKLKKIMNILFPHIKLRRAGSIKDHFHYHEV